MPFFCEKVSPKIYLQPLIKGTWHERGVPLMEPHCHQKINLLGLFHIIQQLALSYLIVVVIQSDLIIGQNKLF